MPIAASFLIGFILEIIVTIIAVKFIGIWWVLALFLLGIVVGFIVMKIQKAGFEAKLAKDPNKAMQDQIANAFIPICFMFPGFLTDIFALLMLIPALRKKFSQKFFGQISADSIISQAQAMHNAKGATIDTVAVKTEAANTPAFDAASPNATASLATELESLKDSLKNKKTKLEAELEALKATASSAQEQSTSDDATETAKKSRIAGAIDAAVNEENK